MSAITDLVKTLLIVQSRAAAGEDVSVALAQMEIPLADIDEVESTETAVEELLDGPDEEAIQQMINSIGRSDFEGQEIFPMKIDWWAKITDGSTSRTGYYEGDAAYYDWNEVYTDPTGGVGGAAFLDLIDGREGSDTNILIECNGRNSVPDDTFVHVTHFSTNGDSTYYFFSYGGVNEVQFAKITDWNSGNSGYEFTEVDAAGNTVSGGFSGTGGDHKLIEINGVPVEEDVDLIVRVQSIVVGGSDTRYYFFMPVPDPGTSASNKYKTLTYVRTDESAATPTGRWVIKWGYARGH